MDWLRQQEAGEVKHSCLHSGEAGKAVGAQQPKLEASAVSFWCWRLGALRRVDGIEFTLKAEETGIRCLTSSCSTRILPLEEWSLPMTPGFLVYLGSQLIARYPHNQGRWLLFRHCHISGNALPQIHSDMYLTSPSHLSPTKSTVKTEHHRGHLWSSPISLGN